MRTTLETSITLDATTAIATALGSDWEAQELPDEYRSYAQTTMQLHYVGADPDLAGAVIRGTSGGYRSKGQWCFTGGTTDTTLNAELRRETYADYNTSVNVSPNKTPAQMAKEMTRRILPKFLPAYRILRQRQRETYDRIATDNALAAQLAAVLGVQPRMRESGNNEATIYTRSVPTLRISYGNVRVEHFSMTPTQAQQFVELIKTWQT